MNQILLSLLRKRHLQNTNNINLNYFNLQEENLAVLQRRFGDLSLPGIMNKRTELAWKTYNKEPETPKPYEIVTYITKNLFNHDHSLSPPSKTTTTTTVFNIFRSSSSSKLLSLTMKKYIPDPETDMTLDLSPSPHRKSGKRPPISCQYHFDDRPRWKTKTRRNLSWEGKNII